MDFEKVGARGSCVLLLERWKGSLGRVTVWERFLRWLEVEVVVVVGEVRPGGVLGEWKVAAFSILGDGVGETVCSCYWKPVREWVVRIIMSAAVETLEMC